MRRTTKEGAMAGVALTASMVANMSSTITPLTIVENFVAVAMFFSSLFLEFRH